MAGPGTRSAARCAGCTSRPARSSGRSRPPSSPTAPAGSRERQAYARALLSSPAMPAVRIKDHWREQRLFELQVTRHDYYAELSQGNRVRTEPIPAARGLIFDRHGEVIAGNQPAYQLELVPEEVPDVDKTLAGLVALNLIRAEDVTEIERTIESSRTFDSVPILLRMSDEDVARFAVRRFEFPGLDIKTRQTRWYPNGDVAVHALGYVGAISEQDLKHIDRAAYAGTALIGKLGVESTFERELHGS